MYTERRLTDLSQSLDMLNNDDLHTGLAAHGLYTCPAHRLRHHPLLALSHRGNAVDPYTDRIQLRTLGLGFHVDPSSPTEYCICGRLAAAEDPLFQLPEYPIKCWEAAHNQPGMAFQLCPHRAGHQIPFTRTNVSVCASGERKRKASYKYYT